MRRRRRRWRTRGEVGVDAPQPGGGGGPGEVASASGGGVRQLAAQRRIGEDLLRVRREHLGVAAVDQEPRAAVLHQRAQPADGRRDDRRATGRRLQGHKAEGLAAAGNEHHVCGAVVGRQQVVGLVGR